MEANETTGSLKEIGKSDPLEIGSRIISGIFTPFMVPFLAFFLLFFFTYLRIMPLQYKLVVLGIVYCFTILMPMLAIYLFQKINGWGIHGQLCSLPAYDVQDSFATLYVGHHCSHTHLHGHLHCDKLQMENQHPCCQ